MGAGPLETAAHASPPTGQQGGARSGLPGPQASWGRLGTGSQGCAGSMEKYNTCLGGWTAGAEAGGRKEEGLACGGLEHRLLFRGQGCGTQPARRKRKEGMGAERTFPQLRRGGGGAWSLGAPQASGRPAPKGLPLPLASSAGWGRAPTSPDPCENSQGCLHEKSVRAATFLDLSLPPISPTSILFHSLVFSPSLCPGSLVESGTLTPPFPVLALPPLLQPRLATGWLCAGLVGEQVSSLLLVRWLSLEPAPTAGGHSRGQDAPEPPHQEPR